MKTNNCLTIKDLCFAYGHNDALRHISLEIPFGCTVCLIAANGSGKTTLLKALAGLLQPCTGEIIICDEADTWKTKSFVAFHSNNPYYQKNQTIASIVRLYSRLFPRFDPDKAAELLNRFEFNNHSNIADLSKGKRALALLIMNLSIDAKLYLLDEPFGSIDISTRTRMKDLLLDSTSEEKVYVISTHELFDMEMLFDEIVFLKEGRVVESGGADDMRIKYGTSLTNIARKVI